jgi:adenylate cyclase class IV
MILSKKGEKMIEIEYKFKLTPKQKEALLQEAIFCEEQRLTDCYYEKKDYSLSLKDVWLRKRNGVFNLKIPQMQQDNGGTFQVQHNVPKQEIYDEEAIKKALDLRLDLPLEEGLANKGIVPLHTFHTIRRKYRKHGITIDMDLAFGGEFEYELCELEIEVPSSDKIQGAINQLEDVMKLYDLTIQPINGKLIELIRLKDPYHYQLLT